MNKNAGIDDHYNGAGGITTRSRFESHMSRATAQHYYSNGNHQSSRSDDYRETQL